MKARLVIKIKPPLVADRKEMLYPIDMSLGKRIKKSRKALGMTQAELGKFLGISGQAVSQWETGETTPETEKLGQLAHTLRVSVDWLLRPSKAEQDAA